MLIYILGSLITDDMIPASLDGQPDLNYELGIGEFGYYTDSDEEEKEAGSKNV